ncbi:MAG TPA: SRPBCC family protein [Nocardioidaceae bacterium]|nr:SRPBCC family protein [Nocardioidaceae bacterium]
MSRTTRVMSCTPEDVFAVLEDGWTYGMWVVGAARIREVEASWPTEGSRIHHSVGAWPVLLSDHTTVERFEPPHVLQLGVRAWPTGEGRVVVTCIPTASGETEVVMEEFAVSGPATLIPDQVQDLVLHQRNVEALRRLAYLAEHRARTRG